MKKLDILDIYTKEADEILRSRKNNIDIHNTGDIRAGGNEIEISILDFLRRMLPKRYYVSHGHIIDSQSNVSPQLDVIIADNYTLPSLFTTWIQLTSATKLEIER